MISKMRIHKQCLAQYELVLVHTHQIEPILLLSARLKEFDLAIPEGAEKALVSDVTHAIQC